MVAFAGVAISKFVSETITIGEKMMDYDVLRAAADRRSSDSRRAPVVVSGEIISN